MSFGIHTGEHSLRRAGGNYEIVDPDCATVSGDTFTCPHCSRIEFVTTGSGKRRGWCGLCGAPTCGRSCCVACVPFEKKLEAFERSSALERSMMEW